VLHNFSKPAVSGGQRMCRAPSTGWYSSPVSSS
jgi:hypothetical protein